MASEVNVWFRGKWYGPSYPDAGDLPAGRAVVNDSTRPEPVLTATQNATFEQVAAEQFGARDAQPSPPPKTGPGSSRAKWVTYAAEHGVTVGSDDTRDDIIDACEAAGVPVEQAD